MDTGDKTFHMGEGETPVIKSCLLHPDREVQEVIIAPARSKFAGVVYGLCWYCDNLRGTQFLEDKIKEEMNLRLNKLEGESNEQRT